MKKYRVTYMIKPETIEPVGNNSHRYHWDIRQEPGGMWSCMEVTVWEPLSSNKILAEVISTLWPDGREQKLINDHNAAVMGLIEGEDADNAVLAYKDFLSQRKLLKHTVDTDCATLGIR